MSEVEASFEVAAFGSMDETRERRGHGQTKYLENGFDQAALTPATSNVDVGSVSETEPPASMVDGDEAQPINVESVTMTPPSAELDVSDDDAFLSFVREMPSQASLEADEEHGAAKSSQHNRCRARGVVV